jgi:hypothetical protein
METVDTPAEQNVPDRRHDEQKALDEIGTIRDQNHNYTNSRQQFELVYEGSLLSGHDVWSLKEVEQAGHQELQDEHADTEDVQKDTSESHTPDNTDPGYELER